MGATHRPTERVDRVPSQTTHSARLTGVVFDDASEWVDLREKYGLGRAAGREHVLTAWGRRLYVATSRRPSETGGRVGVVTIGGASDMVLRFAADVLPAVRSTSGEDRR